MRKRPKVALLIESSRAYGRGLLRGVGAYVRTHRPWSIYVEPHGLEEPLPRWLKQWKGDGILVRITNRRTAQLIRSIGVPAIDLRGAIADTGIPLVGLDSKAAVQLAFEHLREKGFRQFAFCGVSPGQYRFLDVRAEAFHELVQAGGFQYYSFPKNTKPTNGNSWDREQQQLTKWVIGLPKPIGILACNDDRGNQLLNACRGARVAVPEEVAVIGIDNDEVLCDLADPPMSSIESNSEGTGYCAAKLLDQLMAGEIELTGTTLIEPGRVIARRSTDTLAIDDSEVANAMRFIREHACDGVNVDDILRRVPMSRSTLDRRFKKIFGHSASDEIMRLRLERVKQLLVETKYPLATIADLAGFQHSEHMGALFRRTFKQTPGDYRAAQQSAPRAPL